MSVSINLGQCIGCGVCMQVCPDAFRLDENAGKAVLKEHGRGGDSLIKEAVDCCPVGCIEE
ncbi:MAG: ferredoxin [Synergistaceae bacterium]|nr:ferredoxin [Synergistaceae bacterium]